MMVSVTLQKLRVLVVDDMPAVRAILRSMLEDLQVTMISEAEDADVAWHLICQNAASKIPFDLVLADLNMPGISGADLLRSVRSFPLTRKTRFIMVTGEGRPAQINDAWLSGVDDYVVKPFTVADLGEKIRDSFARSADKAVTS